MDPQATLEFLLSALLSITNTEARPDTDSMMALVDEAEERLDDLRGWLYTGGFQPSFRDALERNIGTLERVGNRPF